MGSGKTIAFPLDTIHRQMSVQSLKLGRSDSSGKLKDAKPYKSMVDAFRKIVTRDGWRALFHGLPATWYRYMKYTYSRLDVSTASHRVGYRLQAGPGIAIQFLVYEQMKIWAGV